VRRSDMSGEILGIMGNLEGKGIGRVMRKYAIVFAPNEVIVVKTGGTLGMVFSTLVGEAVGQAYGISTITDVYNRIIGKRSDELKDAQIKDILELDKLNYSIPYSDIEKIEPKKGGILSPLGRMRITIYTKKKKYWFRVVEEKAFDEYVNLVGRILPKKVT
jgi:hypothetical protein